MCPDSEDGPAGPLACSSSDLRACKRPRTKRVLAAAPAPAAPLALPPLDEEREPAQATQAQAMEAQVVEAVVAAPAAAAVPAAAAAAAAAVPAAVPAVPAAPAAAVAALQPAPGAVAACVPGLQGQGAAAAAFGAPALPFMLPPMAPAGHCAGGGAQLQLQQQQYLQMMHAMAWAPGAAQHPYQLLHHAMCSAMAFAQGCYMPALQAQQPQPQQQPHKLEQLPAPCCDEEIEAAQIIAGMKA